MEQKLLELMRNPDAEVTDEMLRQWRQQAPYFGVPSMLAVKRGNAGHEAATGAVLCASDPTALYRFIHQPDGEASGPFYPDLEPPKRPETGDAISVFLENYGHSDSAEDALLERMIFNPAPDYAAVLERQEELQAEAAPTEVPAAAEPDPLIARIDTFLQQQQSQPARTPSAPHRAAVSNHDGSAPLTMSLAALFVRQGRLDKAYEIISELNLKYPEKSAYFADQLRFLEKVLANRGLR